MDLIKKHILKIELLILCLLFYSLFLNRGITLYDEGYVLEVSYLTYLGKIPYKDFFFQYTPLTAEVGAFWFKLFGPGIINLRALALIISSFTAILGYMVAEKFGKPVGFLVFISLVAWGFPHANFLWPSSVSLFFLFLTIYLFVRFIETKKELLLLFPGISTAFLFLTKQNLGIAVFIGGSVFTLYLWLKQKRQFNFLYFFLGNILVLFPTFLYLWYSGSIHGLKELVVRSSMFAKKEVFLFPYKAIPSFNASQESLAKWTGKTFIYLYPVILFASGVFVLLKRKVNNPIWYLVFITTGFYFFSMVWPTADLAHMTFAIPAVLLMTGASRLTNIKLKSLFVYLSLIILTSIGFYKIFFMSYYTFETPYEGQNIPVEIAGDKLYVDNKHETIIRGLMKFKENNLKEEALVFSHPYAPMVYFILEKNPPVYELYTVSNLLSEESTNSVIQELSLKKVDWVFEEQWRSAELDISSFINTNYEETDFIWDIKIKGLKRN